MRIACAALVALIASRSGWAATKGPDAGGYIATNSTVYSFVDIAGGTGGASVLADTDDGTAVLTLSFPFQFYGRAYKMVCVSSNGALYFIADPSECAFNDFANVDITAVAPPGDRPAVMPLWSDLTFQVPGAGAVFYQTLGAVGGRRFVVQWNNAYPQGSSNPVTFQVLLSEGSNGILFQYKTVALGIGDPASRGGQATIGIRNAAALTSGGQIAWSFQAPVISDNTALLFTADTTPPTTTAVVTGPVGDHGWYRDAVQVTLSATDAGGPVAATRYSLDGGAPVLYSVPFMVSGDGLHSVSFFSVDTSGNTENANVLAIKVDATSPTVSATARPKTLWPPNGRTIAVNVSGAVADATSGVDASTARFAVVDEYGTVQPTGSVPVSPDGRYSVAVPLVASRKGRDKDGRTYMIVVSVQDNAGNLGQATTIVTVPHGRDHDDGDDDHEDRDHDDRDRDRRDHDHDDRGHD